MIKGRGVVMSGIKRFIKTQPYTFLFLSIIVLFLITPSFIGQYRILMAFLFLLIMISTILALDLRKGILRLCLGLGIFAFGLTDLAIIEFF